MENPVRRRHRREAFGDCQILLSENGSDIGLRICAA